MDDERLTDAQRAKLRDIPARYRDLYVSAVLGSARDMRRYACLECCAWVPSEVELCSAPGCVAYPYRRTGVHEGKSAAARARALADGRSVPRHSSGGSGQESPEVPENGPEPNPCPPGRPAEEAVST